MSMVKIHLFGMVMIKNVKRQLPEYIFTKLKLMDTFIVENFCMSSD